MPTALASQLAAQASQNAQILLDRSRTRGKHASVDSYLFVNPREAAEHDLDSIFALGRSGFDALSILNPRVPAYEDQLFSYQARNVDRTLLVPEAVRELDAALEGCLQELGAYLLEGAATKILEWLVRRFRVNEFNVRAIIALFLPYHETQHWGKMLTILHLGKESMFKFLVPHQKQAQKPTSSADLILPRQALVQAMLRDGDFARLVVGLLGEALKGPKDGSFSKGKFFRTLVAFWAATMHDFVLASGSKGLSEGTSALVFSAVLEPLSVIPKVKSKAKKSKKYDGIERDTIFTSYIVLATLSSQTPRSLTSAALKVILTGITGAATPGAGIGAQQLVKTLVVVCSAQDKLSESDIASDKDEEILNKMLAVPDFVPEFVEALVSWEGAEKVLQPFLGVLTKRLSSPEGEKASQALLMLESVVTSASPPPLTLIRHITSHLLRSTLESVSPNASIHSLLSAIYQRYPAVLRSTRHDLEADEDFDEDEGKKLDELVLSLSLLSTSPSKTTSKSSSKLRDALIASSNADSSVRLIGVKALFELLQVADIAEWESITEALLARVIDTDLEILEALYDTTESHKNLVDVVLASKDTAHNYLELLSGTLFPAAPSTGAEAVKPPKRAIIKEHLTFVIHKLATANPDWDVNWKNDVFHRLIFPYLLYSKPRGKTTDAVWDLLREAGSTHAWIGGCLEALAAVGEANEDGDTMPALNAAVAKQIAVHIASSPQLETEFGQLTQKLSDPNSHVRLLGLSIIREVLKTTSDAVKLASKVINTISREKQIQQIQIQVEESGLEEALSTKLAAQIVSKPNSRSTDGLLYLALLSDIAALQPSLGTTKEAVDWVYPESQPDMYASLMQQLYVFANLALASGAPQARIHVIRVLFANLGGEAGVFLASVWLRFGFGHVSPLTGALDNEDRTALSAPALYHLSAFLQAHATLSSGIDFQTLLPSVVLALSNSEQEIRKAAVDCLVLLKELSVSETGKGKKFDVVYAFDRVYGNNKNEAELQYLSPDDLAAFVSSLAEMREHFLADGEYIGAWHAEQLASSDKNQEKESVKYRTHILCYLLSHVNALTILPETQTGLLQIIAPCFELAQQRFLGKTKASLTKSKRKAVPETDAALLLVPFLHSVSTAEQGLPLATRSNKATKAKKTGRSVVGLNESAKLAVKVVFGDPGIFELDDAEYNGTKPWDVLCRLLMKVFAGDDSLTSLRPALIECTTRVWVSGGLPKDKRIEIVEVVVDAAVAADRKAQVGDETLPVKTLLGKLLGTHVDDQAQTIIGLLNKYCKALGDTIEGSESEVEPPSKKARVDPSQAETADGSSDEQTSPFQSLAILAEVLASLSITSLSESATSSELGALPPSFDLITHLLETLSQVIRFQASSASTYGTTSVEFVCQNIMSSVDGVATGVRDPPNLNPTPIRLDVLVEIIRVSANPQTLNQALLLIAGLARLAPESVLRNVMPVFTFMGVGAAAMAGGSGKGAEGSGASSMLSRDDGYGWGIVQKTVDSIVPVMVSSLKQSHPLGGLDLYIGARDFLRVFTDAANHIPRHRRTNFFSHLIAVLGPKDFLAPVCLLLIEKSANKIIRSQQHLLGSKAKGKGKEKDTGDAQGALALPTALVHHFEPRLQVWVLAEMLRESERLLHRAISPESTEKTLLDDLSLEDHSVSLPTVFRRRAQAIIAFVGFAAKTFPTSSKPPPKPDAMDVVQPEGGELSDIVSILITLSTKSASGAAGNAEVKIEDIAKSARLSMTRVLSVMSAASFIDTVLLMLSNDEYLIQEGALSLLTTRLPQVAMSVRQNAVSSITQICSLVHRVLSQQPEQSLVVSAFNALRVIGSTLCPGEETSITALIPVLVGAVNVKGDMDVVGAAVKALVSLPAKLGPRLIPHFRNMVSQAVIVLRDGPEGLIVDTVQLLHNLLVAIPTFWSSAELTQITKFYLDLCSASPKPPVEVYNLMKTISKKAPSKILLPTLCDFWKSLENSSNMDAVVGYFDLLKRSIRSATRPAIQDNLRALFNVFLSAFEVTKGYAEEQVATQTISAFVELVIKLNEQSFRPLFRRLYDWAFARENEVETKIMFCRVYIGLLDYFKGLMNPYMSMLLSPLVDILKGYTNAGLEDKELLPPVLETLAKSLACDDGGFWRDDKIRQLSTTLIAQIPVCVKLHMPDSTRALLQDCLVAGAETVSDDSVLKSVNLDILMHTRSEDAKTRLFALTCAEAIWRACGSKLMGFVAETATFIAECCEDENDLVTRESYRLKDAVESVAGSIGGL
ncbi:hypothetical protein GYMLUDRAFT_39424 [Collybiopsis luxurians FD-317 M1]|nr:hypothetical protein GYMLUDRAFT_39424 [Collybiopsis luxurians FD-317 M1]